ncbi:hypothetical protein [Bradyrhizobium sp.]|jgi:hypothetical protein|uniref:hypothetical protein n=1 Tax=Bradyrhizobium sp. TaxID=376 RepID=UPI003D0C7FD7
MKRLILGTVLILGALFGAASAQTDVFRDTLRPGGHDRSMAAKIADGRKCGLSRQNTFTDSAAFQACMQSRGWVLDHVIADRSARFIDPDTGMSCYDQGGASICEPPQGTVKYTDKHGLSCTRTGAMSVCSNF